MTQKDLAIIIVNYNTIEFLETLFDTLKIALEGISARVLFVDNQSVDGSPEYVREHYDWVDVLVTPHNGGYPYGNNYGLREAGYGEDDADKAGDFRYVMLLNTDVEIEPDAFRKMIDFMDNNPDVGVVGPRMIRPNGELDKACRRGEPTLLTSFYHMSGLSKIFPNSPRFARYNMTFVPEDQQVDVDSVMGACMMMRSEALKQVGLMDEQFFMYAEDIDLNVRFRRLGWRVVYFPEARLIHFKGSSTRKVSQRMIREFHKSMRLFHRKHYADKYPAPVNQTVYFAVWMIENIRFYLNEMKPPEKQTVGSAD